jgi:hypothetical protein
MNERKDLLAKVEYVCPYCGYSDQDRDKVIACRDECAKLLDEALPPGTKIVYSVFEEQAKAEGASMVVGVVERCELHREHTKGSWAARVISFVCTFPDSSVSDGKRRYWLLDCEIRKADDEVPAVQQ